jgi:anthranilate phosphoribosyltransferase
VLLNVAVALTVAGCAADIAEGYEKGRAALDGGAARATFDRMRKESRSPGGSGA